MNSYQAKLATELKQTQERVAELEVREQKFKDLCTEYGCAMWRYSRGSKPTHPDLNRIQKLKNDLGIGNGVLS